MESSSIEDDFVFSCFLKKEKERKYWVHPILNIERKEIPLLIKELRDYPGRFKVYFRMSAQFDALLEILEPHIKKTTNFCELRVQGSIYSALCCEMKWMTWQSPFWILAFACTVALNCQNTSQNACHGCEKRIKSNPIRISLWQTKISEAVCKRDWHNVRSYLFFNVRNFRTQCAMALRRGFSNCSSVDAAVSGRHCVSRQNQKHFIWPSESRCN